MRTFSSVRGWLGSAILLTTLLSGCRDEPAADKQAAQVSKDNPATSKTTAGGPSAVATAVSKPATKAPTPAATTSASPAPSASAAADAPPVVPDPTLDCDMLVTAADIETACGVKVEAPADQPTEDIGAERMCSRRFSSKDSGTISFTATRHASAAEALDRYQDFTVTSSKPEPIEGVGDAARSYEKKGASGDPIFAADVAKGRFVISIFNPKITVGAQTIGPVCDQNKLKKLLTEVIKRVP